MAEKVYLGQTLKQPIQIDGLGRATTVKSDANIAQALAFLLATPKGTRFMMPEYGSRIEELIFEPNDQILESLMRTFVYEAIEEWERRVRFVNITFSYPENQQERIDCRIFYRDLASNEIESFVYPFYRQLKY